MNVDILSKIENNVIGRVEYCFLVGFDSYTPNRDTIREEIKTKIGANPELFVIRKVESLSGRKSIKVHVYVYKDKETMRRVEPLYVLKRNKLIVESKENTKDKE